MAKIYARQVKAGKMEWEDVPARWLDAAILAYIELFGEEPVSEDN